MGGKAIPEFVKEFYDYQFRNSEFAGIIRANGATQDGLENAQAGYARMLFDGYPDMSYVNRRTAIGQLHARINITPQWYITSHHFYYEMFYPRVLTEAGEDAEQAVSALNKLLNFDQALIMDTYINGLIDQMRGLVTQVASTAINLAEASGQLSTTAEQAGQAVQGIAATSQEVARAAEDQTNKSTEVTNGMGQLSRAIEQVAQGSQQQASAVEQATTVIGQVSNATQDVARNAQSAAEGSRQASEAATAGNDMVIKTLSGMEKIKGAVDTASERIAGLGEQSAEIGKIVTVIDDIAAQTNLLALNAAIEGARAGEQGRGFAVVADEVRKLAERVTDSVSDVDEPPSAPGAPDVTAASGTTDSLVVDWKEPANTGPAINDYDVQYRKSSDTAWTAHAHAGTATTTTITGLEASTSYQVHVLAKNAEGTSDWSASGTGSTGPPANNPATGEPTITGTAQVGELLTADTSNIGDPDGIDNADFEYQWIANDGTTDSDISGARMSRFWPQAKHLGQTIKVRVTFDDDLNNEESLTSAATGAVAGSAVTVVPADWSLIPSGLSEGDSFRLLFVSSTTRDARSSSIEDYDTHVQNAAANGHADIQAYSAQFKALGSTEAVDARDCRPSAIMGHI